MMAEILREVQKVKDEPRWCGRAWSNFRGDAVERIVSCKLEKHLPEGIKLVRRAWVEGCPNELDILIVDEDAEPIGFTGAYHKDQVHLIVEVKATGVWYKASEVGKRISDYIHGIRSCTDCPVLYLSLIHSRTYAKRIFGALGEDVAFIIQVGRTPQPEEWERFLKRVKELLS